MAANSEALFTDRVREGVWNLI
ncbi:MAG: hypothetical protein HW416_2303, partial [Chloroflexi bacterium]|nr:hypothetical protein [Chloroflexota bacterium]